MNDHFLAMLHPRIVIVAVVIAVSILFIWSYLNSTSKRTKATGETVNFALSETSGTFPVETDTLIEVQLRTSDAVNHKMSAFDVTVAAEGVAQITGVDEPSSVPTSAVAYQRLRKDVTATNARLNYIITAPTADLPAVIKFNVTIRGTGNGNGKLKIDAPSFYIAGRVVESGGSSRTVTYTLGTTDLGDYTFAIVDGATPTPGTTATPVELTPTPGVNATATPPVSSPTPVATVNPTLTIAPPPGEVPVTLDIKVKFQGITGEPPAAENRTLQVKVALVNQQNSYQPLYRTIPFTISPGTNVWTGQGVFNAVPGAGYKILIKGPKHLQKTICDSSPRESEIGVYNCSTGALTITAQRGQLDFTGIHLLAGDLPNQDGISNSYDVSLIRNNLDSTDRGILEAADLNLDGVINGVDYQIINYALRIRGDEQ